MLTELHIRNFALIDELTLRLGPGLGVLTGETGAGKSIIVDALTTALGERTGTEVVRTGARSCLVEAVFDITDCEVAAAKARELGYDPEDGLLIVSREIAREGRSQCRINGRAATSSVIREMTGRLVDVHGQHEHQSLLLVPLHVDLLDQWIGPAAAELRDECQAAFDELTAVKQERDRLQTDERERARLLDLYKFQVDEITAARLDPGEERELEAERNRLANAEKLHSAASEIYEALGGERGAVDGLSEAVRAGERIASVDESMSGFVDELRTALVAAQEALASARSYREEIEANPARLEEIEERLDLIRTLKRKYGDTVQDVLAYAEEAAGKADDLANAEERSQELDARIDELQSKLGAVSHRLTNVRKRAVGAFEQAVERELADLAMERTRFQVGMEPAEPGPKGADSVEFLISPNPGEPVKPLVKIASGGEMSRVMLALKTVMTRAEVPSLVFDEIDAGIGGRTAQVLGDKLASLARTCQVMCVTHLPQIASKAAHHYSVDKSIDAGRTVVVVRSLLGEERVTELARMLGADEGSGAATEHAREMLSLADQGNAQAG